MAKCDRDATKAGLCAAHYMQQRRGQPFTEPRTPRGEGARLDVRVSTELLLQVQAAADAAGMSVADWVRDAIRRSLTGWSEPVE